MAMFLLFLVGQLVTGVHEYNANAIEHGQAPVAFLAIAAMVWLAVYQRALVPESKPVHAPHDETGR